MGGDDNLSIEMMEKASLRPPKDTYAAVPRPIEGLVWKLDPRVPINTVNGEDPYLCLQRGTRDGEKIVGSVDMETGQMVVSRGELADVIKTKEILEKKDRTFDFELKPEGNYWALELCLPGEAKDWLEDKAVKTAMEKL